MSVVTLIFFIFEENYNMKNIFPLLLLAFIISCKKTGTTKTENSVDSTKIVDSINAARTKINDSIRNKNRFANMEETHTFLHNGITNGKGKVTFKTVAGNNDEYNINGEIKSGKEYVKINGFGIRVSEKHFNFTGEVSQSIAQYDNGKVFVRKGTKTFMTKDGGKTWRLQDLVNGSGFVDYIDIRF